MPRRKRPQRVFDPIEDAAAWNRLKASGKPQKDFTPEDKRLMYRVRTNKQRAKKRMTQPPPRVTHRPPRVIQHQSPTVIPPGLVEALYPLVQMYELSKILAALINAQLHLAEEVTNLELKSKLSLTVSTLSHLVQRYDDDTADLLSVSQPKHVSRT
jgi:hypothetical protein